MDKKKMVRGANILFLILVLINVGAGFIDFSFLPTYAGIILAQALILVPVIIYVIVTKQNFFELIRFRKVNFWSVLLVIPVVYLMYPLIACVNAFSMAFSTNVISNTMDSVLTETSYVVALSLMAILPAMVEETTFRGVLLNSYHRDSNPWAGILFSALCFCGMHMNFNQMAYALVMGLMMGILLEASGSIITTMVVHFMYNGTSVTLMYLMPKYLEWYEKFLTQSGITAEQLGMTQQELDEMLNMSVTSAANDVSSGQMLLTAAVMLIPAIIGVALAGLLVYLIAYLNKRQLILKGMFTRKTPEQKQAIKADRVKIFDVFLGIALGVCVIYAILIEVLQVI